MELDEVIIARRSCRYYLPNEVEEDKINLILKAGMFAPVACRRYENILLYVLKGEKLKSLVKAHSFSSKIYGAPLVIMVLHKENNVELRNEDAGAIIQNMCLKATDLGLGSVFNYSIAQEIKNNPQTIDYLKILNKYDVVAGVAIGYKSSEKTKNIKHEIKVIY